MSGKKEIERERERGREKVKDVKEERCRIRGRRGLTGRWRRWRRWAGRLEGSQREEPLNRDNAFIIAALSFIPRAGGGPLSFALSPLPPSLPLSFSVLHVPNPSYPFLFTLFCPQRIHCRLVVGGYTVSR